MTKKFITLHDGNARKIMISPERIVGYSADPSGKLGSVLHCDVMGTIHVVEPPEYLALFLPAESVATPEKVLKAIKKEQLRSSKK